MREQLEETGIVILLGGLLTFAIVAYWAIRVARMYRAVKRW